MSARTPYDGRPFYCNSCGLGYGEYAACEKLDCQLESEEEAKKRMEPFSAPKEPPMTSRSHRDWPEDFAHENGNYECLCIKCGNSFLGHKRRISCKPCAAETAAARMIASPDVAEIVAQMRAGLEGVTPGPWREGVDGNQRIYGQDNRGEDSGLIASWVRRRDLSHVARCSPENILALLDALAAMKAERDALVANEECHDEELRGWEEDCRAERMRAASALAASAKRENALREVYLAAHGLCFGEDWNNGVMAKKHGYRQKLIDAVTAIDPDSIPLRAALSDGETP